MNYGNNILVPFDMMYDIDIGIFKLIKSEYRNPTFIDTVMLGMSNNNFKYMMLTMHTYDPLNILLKDEYKNNSISILNDIITTEYNKVVKLSEPTEILKLLMVYMKTSLVKINILCKTEAEKEIILNDRILKNASIIMNDDYSRIDISKYDSIFIKNYRDLVKFRDLEGKSIFVGRYRFNQEEESNEEKQIIPLKEITVLVGDVNRIYFIDVYTIDDSYPIYG